MDPRDWHDAPEAVPGAATSKSISLRMPHQMLAILKAIARREGVGYQVLLKRWLDERIRQEWNQMRDTSTRDQREPGGTWDVRGWRRLTVHDDPPLVSARHEFLSWLAEVSEPNRTELDGRLRSPLDHAHLSARLELFVHHYFVARNWLVQIHPEIDATRNRPDFIFESDGQRLLVECKSVLDREAEAQQEQRLKTLADQVGRKLGVSVMLSPLTDLPPSLPAARIRNEITRRVGREGEVGEIDVWGTHQDSSYGLRALILKTADGDDLPVGVHGLMSQPEQVNIANRLREAIRKKAAKYGEVDLPFIVAVSAETRFPARTDHEMEALFGDRVWNLQGRDQFTEAHIPNGLFVVSRGPEHSYGRVSAVLFYRFKWLEGGHRNLMHLVHNPHATNPIEPGLLPGISQFGRLSGTQFGWINGEPEPY